MLVDNKTEFCGRLNCWNHQIIYALYVKTQWPYTIYIPISYIQYTLDTLPYHASYDFLNIDRFCVKWNLTCLHLVLFIVVSLSILFFLLLLDLNYWVDNRTIWWMGRFDQVKYLGIHNDSIETEIELTHRNVHFQNNSVFQISEPEHTKKRRKWSRKTVFAPLQ